MKITRGTLRPGRLAGGASLPRGTATANGAGEKRVRVGARRRRSALGRQASRSEPPRSRSGFRRDPTNWHTAVAPRIVGDADGTLCRHRCTRPRLLTANALCTAPGLTVQKAPASAANSTRRAIAAGHRGIIICCPSGLSSAGPPSPAPSSMSIKVQSQIPFFCGKNLTGLRKPSTGGNGTGALDRVVQGQARGGVCVCVRARAHACLYVFARDAVLARRRWLETQRCTKYIATSSAQACSSAVWARHAMLQR